MSFNYTRKNAYDYDSVKKAQTDLNANSTYNKSSAVLAAERLKKEHEANKLADWTGGSYGEALKNQMDKINNREKFTYDLNGDALYQQYKDQYMNQGKLAMQDAMGQAAAMTEGYGNSYADAVGNQAYQGYLSKLNDVVPELYQMALNRYQQEGQDMKDVYSMLQNQYDTEYGEYRDRQNDWVNEQNRLDQNYFNESQLDYNRFSDNRSYYSNLYNAALDWATNDANADYSNRFNEYQQRVSEDQWAKNYQLEKDQLAASKAANDQSAKIAELNAKIHATEDKYKDYVSPDIQKAGNSTAVKNFIKNTKNFSYMPDGKSIKGLVDGRFVRFDNPKQYKSALLEKAYKNNQLTENEVAYLKGYYGIE